MKIIVIGAGIGGLVAAHNLGKGGHEVCVYEKGDIEKLGYDWHDDVNRHIFEKLDLPLPKAEHFFTKGCWTFVTPDEKTKIYLDLPENERDFSIDRKEFAKLYVKRAQTYAKVEFNTTIESLIVENDEVKGVIVGGIKIYADLVIDNSGVFSPFRSSLPDNIMVEKNPARNEVFYAYRALHKRTEGSQDPDYTNKVYLKHLGEEGISWCILDPSGLVNILIGRIGKLSKEVFDNAYLKLKESNPIISDEVLHGGQIYAIPVRHPSLRFVSNGYTGLGDAAFMTIPMLGSGLENSMIAGVLLSDAILKAGNASLETLWSYQIAYYKKVGYLHTGVDYIKRWLLSTSASDLNFLLSKGVISSDDLKSGSVGGGIKLTLAVIIDKIKRVFPKIGVLLKLKDTLDKSNKLQKIAYAIPEKYDEKDILTWENKIKKLFK